MYILPLESQNIFFGRYPVGTPSTAYPEIKCLSSCALGIERQRDGMSASSGWQSEFRSLGMQGQLAQNTHS